MPSVAGLLKTDPLIAQNFYLELDGKPVSVLSGVSGLDIELDVASLQQVGPDRKMQMIKTLGNQFKSSDLTVTRMAAVDASKDELWKWFDGIREKGMPLTDRTKQRKNGSVVLYDTTPAEVGRFNFYNAWPSKVSTDQMSVDSNEPIKETWTFQCERIERVK